MNIIYSHPNSCESNVLCDDIGMDPEKACKSCVNRTKKILEYKTQNPEKFAEMTSDPTTSI